jgi:membrane protein
LALAAGMTYYSLLAIFPPIAGLVAIYGLSSDPTAIARHLDHVSHVSEFCPAAPWRLAGIGSRAWPRNSARRSSSLLGFLFCSANAATKSMFEHRLQTRGFLSLNFMLAGMLFVLTALGAAVVIPVVPNFIGLSDFADLMLRIARWPAMFGVVALALALIYRTGPAARHRAGGDHLGQRRRGALPRSVRAFFPGMQRTSASSTRPMASSEP